MEPKTKTSRRGRIAALLTLLFLSPVMAELLSGSAPPTEFFVPPAFVLLVFWYGVGAILCRELSIRWGSGLPGLFLLGAAFGIWEEGILIKTFFDPHAVDLGVMQGFGWWAGANWPWMLMLTIYHAVVSITLPVLAVHSLWPQERNRSWLSKRAVVVLSVLMGLLALFGWFFLSPAGEEPPYLPGGGQFVGAIVAAGLLTLLAARIRPRLRPTAWTRRWPLFLAGFGWGVWLIGSWIVADVTRSAPATALFSGLFAAGLLLFAYRRLQTDDNRSLVGGGTLAAGAWFFLCLLAILQEFDNAARPDDTTGMALVGLTGLVVLAPYLLYLRRQAHTVP